MIWSVVVEYVFSFSVCVCVCVHGGEWQEEPVGKSRAKNDTLYRFFSFLFFFSRWFGSFVWSFPTAPPPVYVCVCAQTCLPTLWFDSVLFDLLLLLFCHRLKRVSMFSSTSTPRRCVCSTHRAASYFDIDLPSAAAAAAAKLFENDFFSFLFSVTWLLHARPVQLLLLMTHVPIATTLKGCLHPALWWWWMQINNPQMISCRVTLEFSVLTPVWWRLYDKGLRGSDLRVFIPTSHDCMMLNLPPPSRDRAGPSRTTSTTTTSRGIGLLFTNRSTAFFSAEKEMKMLLLLLPGNREPLSNAHNFRLAFFFVPPSHFFFFRLQCSADQSSTLFDRAE